MTIRRSVLLVLHLIVGYVLGDVVVIPVALVKHLRALGVPLEAVHLAALTISRVTILANLSLSHPGNDRGIGHFGKLRIYGHV